MKQYKLKSREFVTQFWEKLGITVTENYLTENEFKIFTYTTEEIMESGHSFRYISSKCKSNDRWIIPIECLQEIYTLKII